LRIQIFGDKLGVALVYELYPAVKEEFATRASVAQALSTGGTGFWSEEDATYSAIWR
jgi:molybdopterin biosynthesis enzyme MoaB